VSCHKTVHIIQNTDIGTDLNFEKLLNVMHVFELKFIEALKQVVVTLVIENLYNRKGP
jgi:hypothetical protein